jgi:ankyrin repeat protein
MSSNVEKNPGRPKNRLSVPGIVRELFQPVNHTIDGGQSKSGFNGSLMRAVLHPKAFHLDNDSNESKLQYAARNGLRNSAILFMDRELKSYHLEETSVYKALQLAIEHDHASIVKDLLDVKQHSVRFKQRVALPTCIDFQSEMSLEDKVKDLAVAEYDTDFSALQLASYRGNVSVVDFLLTYGYREDSVSPTVSIKWWPSVFKKIASEAHWSPLLLAALGGHLEIVKLLLTKESYTTDYTLPIYLALSRGHMLVMNIILKKCSTKSYWAQKMLKFCARFAFRSWYNSIGLKDQIFNKKRQLQYWDTFVSITENYSMDKLDAIELISLILKNSYMSLDNKMVTLESVAIKENSYFMSLYGIEIFKHFIKLDNINEFNFLLKRCSRRTKFSVGVGEILHCIVECARTHHEVFLASKPLQELCLKANWTKIEDWRECQDGIDIMLCAVRHHLEPAALRKLVSLGVLQPKVKYTNQRKRGILHSAVEFDLPTSSFQWLIQEKVAGINDVDQDDLDHKNSEPKQISLFHGGKSALMVQIERLVDCNASLGKSFLESRDRINLMIRNGADMNIRDSWGQSALTLAVRTGFTPLVGQILEANPSVDLADKDGNTALILATDMHHLSIMSLLLEAGADINSKNNHGHSAISRLCGSTVNSESASKVIEVAKFLISKGANLGEGHCSALSVAVSNRNVALVRVLLSCGAQIDRSEHNSRTLLDLAINGPLQGRVELCAVLLDWGADPNGHTLLSNYCPLHEAVKQDDESLCQLLLRSGAISSNEILSESVRRNNERLCRLLLDNYANADIDTEDLLLTATYGLPATNTICKLLVGHVVDLSRIKEALPAAVRANSLELCQLFLEHGADVNGHLKDRPTALLEAVYIRSEPICKLLLSYSADPTIKICTPKSACRRFSQDDSALVYAATSGFKESGIDLSLLNRADTRGMTLLHHRAKSCDFKAMHKLLRAGADPKVRDVKDKIAFDLLAIHSLVSII